MLQNIERQSPTTGTRQCSPGSGIRRAINDCSGDQDVDHPGDVFDGAIADFAEAYADQSERDYEALLGAIESGRVAAETGI